MDTNFERDKSLPNILNTEPNKDKPKKINFNNVDFKSKILRIQNYVEQKKQAKYEQDMQNPERTKFFFDYFNRIKK